MALRGGGAPRGALSSLRLRLGVVVCLTILPVVGVLVVHGYLSARREAEEEARVTGGRIVDLLALDQRRVIDGGRQLAEVLAGMEVVRALDPAGCNRLLSALRPAFPAYRSFGVARPDGEVLCASLRLPGPVSVADRPFFTQTVERRRFTVGQYAVGKVSGEPLLSLGYPVESESGHLLAVAFVSLDLRWLGRIAAEARLPEGSRVVVHDRKGIVLARQPDPEGWGGRDLAGHPAVRAALSGARDGSARHLGMDGVERLYAWRRVGGKDEGAGLWVTAGIPSSRIFAAARAAFLTNLALLAVVGVGAFAAAWLGGERMIVRPARALAAAVTRMGEGDLGARTGLPHDRGTMGRLARAFDDMAGALAERTARLTEAERRATEARLGTILDSSPDAIVSMDPAMRIMRFNRGAERIFGHEARGVLGRRVEILLPERFRAGHEDLVREFALAEGPGAAQRAARRVTGLRRDGTEFLAEASLSAVSDGQGTVFTAILRDITERVETQARLERALGEAESASASKSEFLSRMSHELRTPLNAILGFGQLLEMSATSREDRESVEQILRAGRRLLELVDQVLDLSCAAEGRLALSLEPVGVGEAVRDTLALASPMAGERHIHVRAGGTSAAGTHVRADNQRLRQVLLNLVVNGIRHNVEGGSVEVGWEAAGEGWLRVAVTDDGPGIPLDLQSRLFTPFDRLGAETRGSDGAGVGLALSRHLVEAMGGRIGVRSGPGQGSTFWVELPAVESPLASQPAAEAREGHPAPASSRGAVLYIEDNLSNLTLLERLLRQRPGITLVPAMQGRLGLELARQRRPDLILLDQHLPDLEGIEVLRRLREDPELRDVPVIVLSADTTPGQSERLRAAGARDFLSKPLDIRRLLALLDDILTVEERER